MRGIVPFGAPRCIPGAKRGAHDCFEEALRIHAAEQALGSLNLVRQRASSDAGGRKQATSFVGEREAAFKIGTLRPKLST